jgi:hypothetical protein
MVQVYDKAEIDEFVEPEEIIIVVPEEKTIVKEKEEIEVKKRPRFRRKHKKAICIDRVKRNLDAQIYTNRFVMR